MSHIVNSIMEYIRTNDLFELDVMDLGELTEEHLPKHLQPVLCLNPKSKHPYLTDADREVIDLAVHKVVFEMLSMMGMMDASWEDLTLTMDEELMLLGELRVLAGTNQTTAIIGSLSEFEA